MKEEQEQYAKYEQFCGTTLTDKQRSIDEASEKIEVLEADISKAKSEVKRLSKEIAAHTADIESDTQDSEEATALRKQQRSDFRLTLTDFSESIDALTRALKVLKASDEKVSLSLVQLSAVRQLKNLPKEAMESIDAYLAEQPSAPASAALLEQASDSAKPTFAPNTYDFQSGGVVSMLQDLLDKFVYQRDELEKEEAQRKHAYGVLNQGLTTQLAQSKKDLEEKTEFKAKKLESKAAMEADFSETSAERKSDQTYRDDLKATCSAKASQFDARQKMRQEELEAVDKAKEIIASSAVTGSADKHLPSLLQIRSKHSTFAFLRSDSRNPKQEEAARFLQKEAMALDSRVLAAAASRASADPYAQVRQMIEGLITNMQTAQNDEATKKEWCDTEIAENKAARKEKTDAVDNLKSDVDEFTASIATLGEEVVTLSKEVTETTAAMREATELRLKEKNKNQATIKDTKEAQSAVAQALEVLKEFYAKAGGATALIQQSSKAGQPDIFDEPYTGMGGDSGGVTAMLEVIETDFARLEAETASDEAASSEEYDKFMEDSKIDKATKVKGVEFKTSKKEKQEQELKVAEDDLHAAHKGLDAANTYFEKLQPKCLDSTKSYQEQKAQREKEMQDLQEALDILNGVR